MGDGNGLRFKRHSFTLRGRRIKSDFFQDFPGSPVVKTALSCQGAQVPSLVREIRSCTPPGLANNSNFIYIYIYIYIYFKE